MFKNIEVKFESNKLYTIELRFEIDKYRARLKDGNKKIILEDTGISIHDALDNLDSAIYFENQ